MGEMYLMIPVSDLGCLELTCPKCETTVVAFDVKSDYGVPEICPTCRERWSSPVSTIFNDALIAYQAFFRFFGKKDMPMKPHFRTKEHEENT